MHGDHAGRSAGGHGAGADKPRADRAAAVVLDQARGSAGRGMRDTVDTTTPRRLPVPSRGVSVARCAMKITDRMIVEPPRRISTRDEAIDILLALGLGNYEARYNLIAHLARDVVKWRVDASEHYRLFEKAQGNAIACENQALALQRACDELDRDGR